MPRVNGGPVNRWSIARASVSVGSGGSGAAAATRLAAGVANEF